MSSSIIGSIDNSVDPCENFYDYACGGWIKNNPLPDGYASWGTFGKLTQDNQLILRNLLGNERAHKNLTNLICFHSEQNSTKLSGAEYKAKMYYDSCMDRNGTIEKLKSKPLQEFIDLVGFNKFIVIPNESLFLE